MTPMKRIGLTALLVVGARLFSGTQALAEYGGTTVLTPTADANDADYDASGQASLTDVKLVGFEQWLSFDGTTLIFEAHYRGYLTVKCKDLTPGGSYRTSAGTCKADRNGNVVVKGWVHYWFMWWDYVGPEPHEFEVGVRRLNPDGSLTLVLDGGFPYDGLFGG